MGQGIEGFKSGAIFGMLRAWQKRGDWWTNIDSPDFDHMPISRGYSENQRLVSSGLSALKKNGLWLLRHCPAKLLRQEGASYTGLILRGDGHLPASGRPASAVPAMWQSEARKVGVGAGQPVLYEALCLYGGTQV